jgi:hypothetical protein
MVLLSILEDTTMKCRTLGLLVTLAAANGEGPQDRVAISWFCDCYRTEIRGIQASPA